MRAMKSINKKGKSETPLSPELNSCVVSICNECWPNGFDLSLTDAPNTFKELKREFEQRGKITVFSGNSDDSIYADASINQMARAWHDWAHIQANADFSVEGEGKTCELQCQQISARLGDERAESIIRVLRADVIGQSLYYEKHRKYVRRQKEFVIAYMESPSTALERSFD
jgi:hypothetical protein